MSSAEARLLEFISDRLLKAKFKLCGRLRAVTFVVLEIHPQTLKLLGEMSLSGQP